MSDLDLSVIIPVYNEASRLSKTFLELSNFILSHQYITSEIIFVNDGSTDGTVKLIEGFISKFPDKVRLISDKINHGKGYAVRIGMNNSFGHFCLMVDADMSTPMTELDKFLNLTTTEGPLVIIGSRKGQNALLIKKQPWYRQKIGELYAIFAGLLTGLVLKDYGCGFKLFSRQVVDDIFSIAIINRWTFDTEILFLSKKFNYPIIEVGVCWTDDRDTKVNLFKDVIQSGIDLIRITIIHRNI